MNIGLMKVVDSWFGRLLTTFLPAPVGYPGTYTIQSILIIRPGGIGDAVLLAPTILELKRQFPNAQISVLAERRNVGVFALTPAVDRLYCYDRPGEFVQALRGVYDLVVDTEQWHRLSAIVARLVRAPMKIGFDTNERRRMFTHTVPYSHDDYEVISFARLLEPLRIEGPLPDIGSSFLAIPPDAKIAAQKLLEPLVGKPFVTFFSGASIPERRWGVEQFKYVAQQLISAGWSVVVVGGKDDAADAQKLEAAGVFDLTGKTSLAETAAVIGRSSLLISGDSGVLHIAVGLGVPSVSLFGPGRALKWAPCGDRHSVLNKQCACSPCTTFGTTPPCPYTVRCMQEITVDEVSAAALKLLARNITREEA